MENILISLSRCQGATESEPGRHTYIHTHTQDTCKQNIPHPLLSLFFVFWNSIYLMNRARPDLNMRKAVAQKGERYWNIKASLITTDFLFLFLWWLAKSLTSLCKHPPWQPLSSVIRATVSALSCKWWAKSVPEYKRITINTRKQEQVDSRCNCFFHVSLRGPACTKTWVNLRRHLLVRSKNIYFSWSWCHLLAVPGHCWWCLCA